MKNACESLKEQLLEAALTGSLTAGLEEHLRTCTICSEEMDNVCTRKARLDTLLPLVAQGSEPSANFRARVLAAAEAAREGKQARPWRVWTLAGATAVVVAGFLVWGGLRRRAGGGVTGGGLSPAHETAEKGAAPRGVLGGSVR